MMLRMQYSDVLDPNSKQALSMGADAKDPFFTEDG